MRPLTLLALTLPLAACLPDLDEDSNPPVEGDTDTDTDADSDSDADADSDSDADADSDVDTVLVDEELLLPGPDGHDDYVDFTFDIEAQHLDAWLHIELSAARAIELRGILLAPGGGCNLEVPEWGAYMQAHANQGWVRPQQRGRYILSVFGDSPHGGDNVHTVITVIPSSELPFANGEEPCTSGAEACECTELCNCREIHS
jgi:hypothetical protein